MRQLKDLASQLPFWEFVGNYLAFSDHSFGAGFKIQGVDISAMDSQEMNLTLDKLEKLLMSLDSGAKLQILYKLTPNVLDKIDMHLTVSENGSEDLKTVSQFRYQYLSDLAHKGYFFKPEIYLFVRGSRAKLRKQYFFEKEEKWRSFNTIELSNTLNQFEKIVSLIYASLDSSGFQPIILNSQEWFDLIFEHLNPNRINDIGSVKIRNSMDPFSDSLAEQLCLTDLEVGPKGVKFRKSLARVITLKTLPEQETYVSMIDSLLKLPFPFELSQTLHSPDQRKEQEKISVQRRIANSMVSGSKNVRDLESEAQLNELETLISDIISGSEKIIYTSISVIIRGDSEDDLDQKSDEVLKAFRQMNSAEAIVETLPSFEGYMKSLPGNCDLFRPRKMKSSNATHFMPLFSTWDGNSTPVALIPNREGVLVSIDPFAPELPNWNGIIFGGSGSGKSFTVANLILSFIGQSSNPKVIWIDNGASSQKLVESLGGEFINLSLDAGICLNLFDLELNEIRPSPSKIKLILAVLETILKEDDKKSLPKREKALLEEVIYETYEYCYPKIPVLSDLREKLKTHSSIEMRNYSQTLFSWTGNTAYGKLLDGPSNVTLTKSLTTVEISGLNSHPSLQNVFLLLLTDFIRSEAAKDLRTPYLLIIDEAWRVFQASESGKEFALECYRLLRKFMAGIYCLSQNYRDFLSDPQIAEAILPNTTHVFVLRQKKIDWEDFQKIMSLKDSEIKAIQSLEIKKGEYSEIFYMQDDKRSLLRLRPDPLSYLICTSDGKDKAMIEDARIKNPNLSNLDLLLEIAEESLAD